MSDLQLSLLVIGVVVVGGVYAYNWLQERRFRRGAEEAFGETRDDVLLKTGAAPALARERVEPQLMPAEPAGESAAAEDEPADANAGLDYVIEINADAVIADGLIGELMSRLASCGKPVRVSGLDATTGAWEDAVRGRGGRFHQLRVSLQLVNRSGPANAAQLAGFCDVVRSCAEKMSATAVCPDTHEALRTARDLDAFCADVDVAVGVNIVAAEGNRFAGIHIRSAAEAAGFKLEPDGVFHFRGEHRETLFTLDNHEPAPFLPESIKGLSTRGITLLMDVPRVANGAGVLDRMLVVAQELVAALDGQLVDDNSAPLSDAGLTRIKDQVRTIHAKMDLLGIPSGSTHALRLFS